MNQIDLIEIMFQMIFNNINTLTQKTLTAQSVGAVKYTEYISKVGLELPLTSILDMALNWSSGKCGVPLHCHYSQIHSGSEWLNREGFHYVSSRTVQLFTKDYYN